MAENDNDRVWELTKKIPICMLSTWTGQELRARPMDARSRPEENTIYFLTDARHHKDDEIEKYPQVMLAFADHSANKFLSLSGRAVVSNDRAKIKELWEPTAQAWWKDENDPNIRVLKITPTEAEFWDGPGRTVAMIKMMVAAATGSRPDMGENRKVSM